MLQVQFLELKPEREQEIVCGRFCAGYRGISVRLYGT